MSYTFIYYFLVSSSFPNIQAPQHTHIHTYTTFFSLLNGGMLKIPSRLYLVYATVLILWVEGKFFIPTTLLFKCAKLITADVSLQAYTHTKKSENRWTRKTFLISAL